ncbi:MAG: NRDE family protein [Actinobacteria bacterium]|nr:NRDE family protein [Actinomycetota bacterium]
MCTVVIRIPENTAQPIRLLAVRDEDPNRPWNPLGEWWPQQPQIAGVQDRLAGGAWLAADPAAGRLSVLLNRHGAPDLPAEEIASRGGIVLDSVADRPLPDDPRTMGFNLVRVAAGQAEHQAELVSWDGHELRRTPLPPGTHMIAHGDLDDAETPRIVAWRDAFASEPTEGPADGGEAWWHPWLDVLERSTSLSPQDDRAIIRDNRTHGYPTLSLLACVASISRTATDVRYAQLDEPGTWSPLDFSSPGATAG